LSLTYFLLDKSISPMYIPAQDERRETRKEPHAYKFSPHKISPHIGAVAFSGCSSACGGFLFPPSHVVLPLWLSKGNAPQTCNTSMLGSGKSYPDDTKPSCRASERPCGNFSNDVGKGRPGQRKYRMSEKQRYLSQTADFSSLPQLVGETKHFKFPCLLLLP